MKKIYKNVMVILVVILVLSGAVNLSGSSFSDVTLAEKTDLTKKPGAPIHEGPIDSSSIPHGKKRVIILYKDSVTEQDADKLEKRGLAIKHRHNIIPAITAVVDEQEIDDIKRDNRVKAVYDDIQVYASLDESVPQINADQVHTTGITGLGVKTCIVDTGVDDSHPSLPALLAEFDFVNNDADATDDQGHGTHVAGIVASRDSTFKGTAPGSDLMATKVLNAYGSGFSSDVIAGIEFCVANGADIINMSLGGGAFSSACNSEPLAQASNNAVRQGVTVFAASGNNGFINAMLTPACGSQVIAVGAVYGTDGRTPFSNEGTQLDLVGPGVSIHSSRLNGGFTPKTGTSMATPHGAGIAALLLEADPSLTSINVRKIIENTALDLGKPGFDPIFGHGRMDAVAALSSPRLSPGQGRRP
jgi:subtilisin family serine protease